MPITDIPWAVDDLNGRAEGIRLRENYYDGKHKTTIPQGKTLSRELRDLLDDLNDNLCDDVVDEPVNRMAILTWTGKRNGIGTAAIESWERNRGDARAREVHRNGWRAGDGFVIVQQDSQGRARWYSQHPSCMAVRYSKEYPDEIEVAAKVWREGKGWRLNLYYGPQGQNGSPWVERYASRGTNNDGAIPGAKAFAPIQTVELDDGTAVPPVESLEGDRIPVFHFPADNIGGYGKSALTPTVIGLQDVLNKSVVDMVVAMEAAALPDRWATGIQAEYDPITGDEKPLQKTGRERLIRTGSKDAQFGQFQQATMEPFLNTQKDYRLEIARKGYLPAYTVDTASAGNAPSGLSLLIADGRLVKRVKTAQDDWGVEWRAMQAFMLRMEGAGDVQANDLEIGWAPAETRDEKSLLESLSMKVELGLPKREALIEAGYDEDDVDAWLEDAEAQRQAIAGGRVSAAGASGLVPAPPAPSGAATGVPAAPVQPAGAAAPAA